MRHPQLIDDERLGQSVTAGDSQAFSILYERYYRVLHLYCRSIVHSDADAHDVVQSAFTRALEALRRNQRDAPLRPWLFRIAHNEAISSLRRRRASELLAAHVEPQGISVEGRVRAQEELRSLIADLQELPEGPRGAIVLRELSGLSHDEIAATLGTTASAVKHAIHEARTALSELARGRQMDCRDVRGAIVDGDRRVLRSRRIRAHLSDCAECARFAAARPRRSGRLRALPPLAGVGAFGHLLAREAHRVLSTSAQDTTFATGAVSAGAGKLVAALGTKVVIAGVIATGAVTAGVSYDSNQGAAPAAHAVRVGSTAPDPVEAGHGARLVREAMTVSSVRAGQRQALISIPRLPGLGQQANRGGSRAGTTRAPGADSAVRGSNSSAGHSATEKQPPRVRGGSLQQTRPASPPSVGPHGSPPGQTTSGAASGSRGSARVRAPARGRGNGNQASAGVRSDPPGPAAPVDRAPQHTGATTPQSKGRPATLTSGEV